MAKNKRKKYYAVAKGQKTGVYTSWDDCKEQVHGYSKNQYRGFATKSEAEDYVQKYSDSNNTTSSSSQSSPGSTNRVSSYSSSTKEENSRKRIRLDTPATNDQKRTRSTPTSASSTGSSRYEYSDFTYYGVDDDDDPVRDYYHSHGFYGYS